MPYVNDDEKPEKQPDPLSSDKPPKPVENRHDLPEPKVNSRGEGRSEKGSAPTDERKEKEREQVKAPLGTKTDGNSKSGTSPTGPSGKAVKQSRGADPVSGNSSAQNQSDEGDEVSCPSGERTSPWMSQDGFDPLSGYSKTLETMSDFVGGVGDFVRNRSEMVDANVKGADKFFHCMANCEASSRGSGGEAAAKIMSYGREATDTVRNVLPKELTGKGMTFEASLKDSRADMAANRVGFDAGRSGERCLDACRPFRPRGL